MRTVNLTPHTISRSTMRYSKIELAAVIDRRCSAKASKGIIPIRKDNREIQDSTEPEVFGEGAELNTGGRVCSPSKADVPVICAHWHPVPIANSFSGGKVRLEVRARVSGKAESPLLRVGDA